MRSNTGRLSALELAFVQAARRGVLATIAPGGSARLVPICFAIEPDPDGGHGSLIWSPLDEKPKRTADPLGLARVRDIAVRDVVTLLVDRWSEDWDQLAWVRLRGTASLEMPGDPAHPRAIGLLRDRYPQYRGHRLEQRPVIRIAVDAVASWGQLDLR